MLLQMSGDQLITTVGGTLHRHPDHADVRAAVAIDRDKRCRVGTEELACDVVEFRCSLRSPYSSYFRAFRVFIHTTKKLCVDRQPDNKSTDSAHRFGRPMLDQRRYGHDTHRFPA